MRAHIVAFAALISLSQPGRGAELLAAGPMFADSLSTVSCLILNFSATNAQITNHKILSNAGARPLLNDSCASGTLQALKECSFSFIPSGTTGEFSCRVVYAGSVKQLTGVMSVDHGSKGRDSVPMQTFP
jgi:hypothetical protein